MAPRKAAAEAVEIEHGTLPAHPGTLSGPEKERVAIWARQSKTNTIALCKHKETLNGAERECYHPLVAVRDPANGNNPTIVEVTDPVTDEVKKGILHVCSWNPKEHGEQVVYPPKKEDEI